jgi:hypothetical protein
MSSRARGEWGNLFYSFLLTALVPSASTSSATRRPDIPETTPAPPNPEEDLMNFD